MQRDHLLSAAGVSEQAGRARARARRSQNTHTHTQKRKRVNTRVLTEGSAGTSDSEANSLALLYFFSLLFFWGGF